MNLGEQAYHELLPDRRMPVITVTYSGHLNDFNATVRYNAEKMDFRLSKKWKDIGDNLQIGVIQHLLAKVFKLKQTTLHMDLYDKFIKHLSTYAKKTKTDPILEASFARVNEQYLDNELDRPNLEWGRKSFRKLGSYEYASDTITISTILLQQPELLDYVMYHELLHKKFKFTTTNNRSRHHTAEFKRWEKRFQNPHIEKELEQFLARQKLRQLLRFW